MNLLQKKTGKKFNNVAAFIFDWDVDDDSNCGIVGIIKDVRLRNSNGDEIRHSSLIWEEIGAAGWDPFLMASDIKVSGRYRWEGRFFASQDYYGEWDSGWDLMSLEPADRKTRKALAEELKNERR